MKRYAMRAFLFDFLRVREFHGGRPGRVERIRMDAARARLCAVDGLFDRPPVRQFWGGTVARFRHPDGNVLTLLG